MATGYIELFKVGGRHVKRTRPIQSQGGRQPLSPTLAESEEWALQVVCTSCGARKRKRCLTNKGKLSVRAHQPRVADGRKLREAVEERNRTDDLLLGN